MKKLLSILIVIIILIVVGIVVYPWGRAETTGINDLPAETAAKTSTQANESVPVKLSEDAQEISNTITDLNNSGNKKELYAKRKELKDLSNELLEDEVKARQVLSELIVNPDISLQMRAVSMLGKVKKPWSYELLSKSAGKDNNKAVRTASFTYLAQARPKGNAVSGFAKMCKTAILDGIKDSDQDIRFSAFKLFCSFSNHTYDYKPEAPAPESIKAILNALNGFEK